MDVLDFLGNIIKEGDQIVWPNRQGSMMWMNTGHVVHIGSETAQRPGTLGLDENKKPSFIPGEVYEMPVLQVARYQGLGEKTKRVEIRRVGRVVALGRWDRFKPMKEPIPEFTDMSKPFKETWLDKVMKWLRG